MQKNPDAPKAAENAQAAEGELPDAKLAEVSGGGSLGGAFGSLDNSPLLDMLKLQQQASQATQAATQQANLISSLANSMATKAKTVG